MAQPPGKKEKGDGVRGLVVHEPLRVVGQTQFYPVDQRVESEDKSRRLPAGPRLERKISHPGVDCPMEEEKEDSPFAPDQSIRLESEVAQGVSSDKQRDNFLHRVSSGSGEGVALA